MTTESWEVWEIEVNRSLGLTSTPGSGSQWYEKGDGVDTSDSEYAYQVDSKYTNKASRSIKYQEFKQLRQQALMAGKKFAMPIRIDPGKGPALDVVVITFEDFSHLIDVAKNMEDDIGGC